MSGFLGDLFDFEGFNAKKIGKALLKDPSRLLTGVDPASTGFWNTLTGDNKEALVDQMGGPMGSTYKEAKDAGINTHAGRVANGIAHAVAAFYALGGGAGGGGSGAAGGGYAGETGLTSAELTDGAGMFSGGGLDPSGLAALDSQAVSMEGAEPGLTEGYGSQSMSPLQRQMLSNALKSMSQTGQNMQNQQEQQRRLNGGSGIQQWNYVG